MKILLTGGSGLLGADLLPELRRREHDVIAPSRTALDLRDPLQLLEAIESFSPDLILNLAAFTDVDRAEFTREEAHQLNAEAPGRMAHRAAELGIRFVHLSTDYVFDGAKRSPYKPEDPPSPVNVYGASKARGEEQVLAAGGEPLIVRTSWLYGGAGRGFVDAILAKAEKGMALSVVDDQRGGPTWSGSISPALVDLIETGKSGVWHLSNPGEASWYEVAVAAIEEEGLLGRVEIRPVSQKDWGAAAVRPAYSVLDNTRTADLLGRSPLPWRDALGQYLEVRRGLSSAVSGG